MLKSAWETPEPRSTAPKPAGPVFNGGAWTKAGWAETDSSKPHETDPHSFFRQNPHCRAQIQRLTMSASAARIFLAKAEKLFFLFKEEAHWNHHNYNLNCSVTMISNVVTNFTWNWQQMWVTLHKCLTTPEDCILFGKQMSSLTLNFLLWSMWALSTLDSPSTYSKLLLTSGLQSTSAILLCIFFAWLKKIFSSNWKMGHNSTNTPWHTYTHTHKRLRGVKASVLIFSGFPHGEEFRGSRHGDKADWESFEIHTWGHSTFNILLGARAVLSRCATKVQHLVKAKFSTVDWSGLRF